MVYHLNRKEQLRHHAVSLRQHGFLVQFAVRRPGICNHETDRYTTCREAHLKIAALLKRKYTVMAKLHYSDLVCDFFLLKTWPQTRLVMEHGHK